MQVRYALGLRDLHEGYFDLRTIYYFRKALIDYEQLHGVNLIQKAMEKITDVQLKKFNVKSGFQRMDSTQIQSNIQKMSRLQLLKEAFYSLLKTLRRTIGTRKAKAPRGMYPTLQRPVIRIMNFS